MWHITWPLTQALFMVIMGWAMFLSIRTKSLAHLYDRNDPNQKKLRTLFIIFLVSVAGHIVFAVLTQHMAF